MNAKVSKAQLVLFAALIVAGATYGQGITTENATEDPLQNPVRPSTQKVVVITGARFTYALVEKWIDDYNKVNPRVQIIVESRGTTDPINYDILAEVNMPDEMMKQSREFIYIARYAILPVANSTSSFARHYAEKGLTTDLIKQIFFQDVFSDKSKHKAIAAPYTVYTRLQKAGVPATFSEYFGYEQKDLQGTSIAGADAHMVKAVCRDSIGVTYLPLPLIYNESTRKPVDGLTVLPVDINGNKKVSDDENFYETIDRVVETLEALNPGKINNIPIGYLHLSVDRTTASAEAIDFLKWVNEHGQERLHAHGYLKPEPAYFEKDKFMAFASAHGR